MKSKIHKQFIIVICLFALLSCYAGGSDDGDDNQPNTPPVSEDHDFEIEKNSVLEEQLWAYDSDGDDISFYLENSPTNGVATISLSGELVYTPNADYLGIDQLTFFVSDDVSSSEDYIITINVVESII